MYSILRPLLFALPPETAHHLALGAAPLLPKAPADDPILAARVAGLSLPNPIGLAAGLDKDAVAADAFLRAGFGFVEVGTITPRPQAGNPKPRLFRLPEDRALINRMGFNNGGLDAARARLTKRGRPGIVGVNVGANKDSADRIADYVTGVTAVRDLASYITINISSPNTPGLRALQSRAALSELVEAVMAARGPGGPPLFVKVAPDLQAADIDDIAQVALQARIDGLIVSNTTIARPPLKGAHARESGGLSGAPLTAPSTAMLRAFRQRTEGRLALIGVGGVSTGADAYAKLRAGADLVQLYTALIYEGPGLVTRVKRELAALMRRDGFGNVADVVGADAS